MFKDSKLSCTFVRRIILHRVIKLAMKNVIREIYKDVGVLKFLTSTMTRNWLLYDKERYFRSIGIRWMIDDLLAYNRQRTFVLNHCPYLARVYRTLAVSQTICHLFRYHLIQQFVRAFHLLVQLSHRLL